MPKKRSNRKSGEKKPDRQGGVSRSRLTISQAGEDHELLQAELEQLGTANRQLKRKIFDLYTVFEISRNFNAVLDYHSLLDGFIFTCLGQMGALKGTIFLQTDGRTDRFCPVMSKGSGALPGTGDCLPSDSRLARYLARLNRPSAADDLIRDFHAPAEKRALKCFAGGIVAPLIYRNTLTGVFAIAEKISGREFSVDDIEFLSILGNQIAVAIENARLYESERRATEQLRAAQQQLVQTERLAALGDMSAKIAHEINNPLGIIKNYLLLLDRSRGIDAAGTKYVSVVRDEINRIAGIVKELLDFHRPQEIPATPVDIQRLIDNVLDLMQRQLESASISVVRRFLAAGPIVIGNAEQLKQVFLNLIINARDALTGGGELSISVTASEGTVSIQVCDTGPGVPPELVERIFEPFFTTKEPGKGTGLGLSVCYGIIRKHGWSILFRNTEHGGCFEITLPEGQPETV